MRVFLFDHVCGGGVVRQPLDAALAQQSAAMLCAVADDFLRASIRVLTTLDHRFDLALPGADVLPVGPGDTIEPVIDQLAAEADWALVLAPESDGVLEAWSSKLTAAGARRLGSRPDAITLCADKLAMARTLGEAGVPTLPTRRLDKGVVVDRPLVVKRRRGAAHGDIHICRKPEDLAALPFGRDWIVQPYHPGKSVSTSFIVHGQKRRRLLACEQCVEQGDHMVYHGGRMPLDDAGSERAFALAHRAIERIGGLRGFVGVDLILTDDPADDVVVEINARPTMAYVGLARLCTASIARALIDPDAPLAWKPAELAFEADGRILWEHDRETGQPQTHGPKPAA
jgi:tyramine---L-glutamate ligase